MKDFDINKLKAEIESRNTEKTKKDVALGMIPDGAILKKNKRAFLNELRTSMHNGVETEAVTTIRTLNETVEQKKGAPNAAAKNTNKYIPPRPNSKQLVNEERRQPTAPVNDWGIPSGVASGGHGDGERDELFEQANAKYDQMMMSGNPVAANYLQNQKQPKTQYITEEFSSNADFLTEKIERNLEKMVESSFKSVLTNIYTKQKIQESLVDFLESEDFVKIVGKAINEIAKRNKARHGK